MTLLPTVFVAAEDDLGVAIAGRLLGEHSGLLLSKNFVGKGFGRIKRACTKYQKMAESGLPVLLLTDLDEARCPPALINAWLGAVPHQNFLFRICVREVETWLLGDIEGLTRAIGARTAPRCSEHPESIGDPKGELLRLAASATGAARAGICPEPNSSATIGPSYNLVLGKFVREKWRLDVASKRCPSLARARARVKDLAFRVAEVKKRNS